MSITKLEPNSLWKHFYAFTQIPRPSKHESKAIEYVKKFAESQDLEYIEDEIGNIIIKKPASKGMENSTGIVLQAHVDMVPQKNSDKEHNFQTDPIEAYADGEWVTANGTTLGADNGIGAAAMLAILESKDMKHPALEALFTIDEETGMTGAFQLGEGLLNGKIMINLDSEDEDEIFVGCAGGVDAEVTMDYKPKEIQTELNAYNVNISGLKGGHSGLDINLGRGNANIVLARILNKIKKDIDYSLVYIKGGDMRNAIPRESSAVLVSENKNIVEMIETHFKEVANELEITEPDMLIKVSSIENEYQEVFPDDFQERFINSIVACPNGVIRMSDTMDGVVETSTNLAIVDAENGKAKIYCLLRSSVDSAKAALADRMEALFNLAGGEVEFSGDYPGWKPNPKSEILKIMIEVFKQQKNQAPAVKAIHAGLECGILGAKYPQLDMVSCGPTIRFPHSPDEKVHIDSVKRFWEFLLAVLEKI